MIKESAKKHPNDISLISSRPLIYQKDDDKAPKVYFINVDLYEAVICKDIIQNPVQPHFELKSIIDITEIQDFTESLFYFESTETEPIVLDCLIEYSRFGDPTLKQKETLKKMFQKVPAYKIKDVSLEDNLFHALKETF